MTLFSNRGWTIIAIALVAIIATFIAIAFAATPPQASGSNAPVEALPAHSDAVQQTSRNNWPRNLTITNDKAESRVTLTWDPPTNWVDRNGDEIPAAKRGYWVQWRTSNHCDNPDKSSYQHCQTDPGYNAGNSVTLHISHDHFNHDKLYIFRVGADGAGNSAGAVTVEYATTPTATPEPTPYLSRVTLHDWVESDRLFDDPPGGDTTVTRQTCAQTPRFHVKHGDTSRSYRTSFNHPGFDLWLTTELVRLQGEAPEHYFTGTLLAGIHPGERINFIAKRDDADSLNEPTIGTKLSPTATIPQDGGNCGDVPGQVQDLRAIHMVNANGEPSLTVYWSEPEYSPWPIEQYHWQFLEELPNHLSNHQCASRHDYNLLTPTDNIYDRTETFHKKLPVRGPGDNMAIAITAENVHGKSQYMVAEIQGRGSNLPQPIVTSDRRNRSWNCTTHGRCMLSERYEIDTGFIGPKTVKLEIRPEGVDWTHSSVLSTTREVPESRHVQISGASFATRLDVGDYDLRASTTAEVFTTHDNGATSTSRDVTRSITLPLTAEVTQYDTRSQLAVANRVLAKPHALTIARDPNDSQSVVFNWQPPRNQRLPVLRYRMGIQDPSSTDPCRLPLADQHTTHLAHTPTADWFDASWHSDSTAYSRPVRAESDQSLIAVIYAEDAVGAGTCATATIPAVPDNPPATPDPAPLTGAMGSTTCSEPGATGCSSIKWGYYRDKDNNDAKVYYAKVHLRFSSDNLKLSYKTIRDHSVTSDDATIKRAIRRNPPANQSWHLHVVPDTPNGEFTITVPVRECNVTGAICTRDNVKLSQAVTITVDARP